VNTIREAASVPVFQNIEQYFHPLPKMFIINDLTSMKFFSRFWKMHYSGLDGRSLVPFFTYFSLETELRYLLRVFAHGI
jgi:hypothetical protein